MMIRQSRVRSSSRGITSVVVLICLVVVTLMSGVLVKIGVAHRDQVRAQERQLQAEWLAQAGLDRALFRLAASAGYTGETWQIGPAELVPGTADGAGQEKGAVVRIKVEPAGSGSAAKLIKVQADYPPDPPRRARHSLQIQVELGSLKRGVSR
jgi:type II secretory pathway component PulK